MENKHQKVNFDIISCVNLPTQVIPGYYIHPQVNSIEIQQTEISKWKAVNKVKISLSDEISTEEAVDIGEEVRDRLTSLFVLVSKADVSATDEITLAKSDKHLIVVRRGGKRGLQKLHPPVKINITTPVILKVSELEWNALKRFKKTFISTAFSEKFEALVGSIDILGKNDFPELANKVTERIKTYLQKKTNIEPKLAKIIAKARHKKIHENVIQKDLRNCFYNLREQISDDLANRFGMKILKPPFLMRDEFRIGIERESKNRKE